MSERLTASEYVNGIFAGDRMILSRSITLVESKLESDIAIANEVLTACFPKAGKSFRLGLTGVPGVGKSTFIDIFGSQLASKGHKVAVLAVDPSSSLNKGSILGDKTRMEKLSREANAFIRPTPAGGYLGGVASRTREAILLCEAAGFDSIIVETVGVGQSETAVSSMVDFFMLIMLPGAGDELQGMKKGIMEMADAVIINKADGNNVERARIASAEYQSALHLFPPSQNGWFPKVLKCSALEETGITEILLMLLEFRSTMQENGWFKRNRESQSVQWLEEGVRNQLEEKLFESSIATTDFELLKKEVRQGKWVPSVAARKIVSDFLSTH